MADKPELYAMRHSLAHITANAIQHLWPATKFGVGPVTEDGFYYDVDIDGISISEDNFGQIETEMRKIISADEPFEQLEMEIGAAIDWARQSEQPYKLELLNDLQREGTTNLKDLNTSELGLAQGGESKVDHVSFYRNGDFIDLCRGPHVSSTGKVGAFKLLRVSGAYWRGQSDKPQMQRVYGLAFLDKAELSGKLELIELAKQNDHRKLGQELDLFVFSDLVGPGLPMFTPRGTVIRDELDRFSQELQAKGGYEKVTIPHITKVDLYKRSGHYDKYPERFTVSSIESDDEFMMKPMNCPHHTQIYASKPRSYRDLPIRYMETTMVYRDEKAGELHGLSRVRAATQDDSHAFCRHDQIEAEFESIAHMVKEMYEGVFRMPFRVRLAFRDDSDKYLGDHKLWETAENSIQKIADKLGFSYVIEKGEATFYGPKIEFVVKDALGRENQCATIQLDFVQPERFDLLYTTEKGEQQHPVMIHKALLGSIERFLSVYIEHTGGKFPVWLAPEQVRLITVNQEEVTLKFANSISNQAYRLGLRLTTDNTNESVGKKIRRAEQLKIPYTIVCGQKEIETNTCTPRIRQDLLGKNSPESTTLEFAEFLQNVSHEAMTRSSKSSF
jgi:threonyl-tRNA synthetase